MVLNLLVLTIVVVLLGLLTSHHRVYRHHVADGKKVAACVTGSWSGVGTAYTNGTDLSHNHNWSIALCVIACLMWLVGVVTVVRVSRTLHTLNAD